MSQEAWEAKGRQMMAARGIAIECATCARLAAVMLGCGESEAAALACRCKTHAAAPARHEHARPYTRADAAFYAGVARKSFQADHE
jgi:hypothetical protein